MTGPQPPPPACTVPLVELQISEELDRARLPRVSPVLDRILALRPAAVVIDLSGCRHVDAAGIGLLLDVHRRLARRQAVLTLRNPNPRIRRILETARLDQVLPVLGSAGRDRPDDAGQGPAASRVSAPPVVQGRARVTVRS